MSKDAQQRGNTFYANSGFKDVLTGGEQYIVALCGSCEVFCVFLFSTVFCKLG